MFGLRVLTEYLVASLPHVESLVGLGGLSLARVFGYVEGRLSFGCGDTGILGYVGRRGLGVQSLCGMNFEAGLGVLIDLVHYYYFWRTESVEIPVGRLLEGMNGLVDREGGVS